MRRPIVSNTLVWTAVADMASEWRKSNYSTTFVSGFPRDDQKSTGVAAQLEGIFSTNSFLKGRPLRMGTYIIRAKLGDPNGPGMKAWLLSAAAVEAAAKTTNAWLRAQLPRYPQILVPQLARGSHRTTPEFTWAPEWAMDDLSSALQFQASPPGVARVLGLPTNDVDKVARALAQALQTTDEWAAFATSQSSLSDADRNSLNDARKALSSKLSKAGVDAHEPDDLIRRTSYRAAMVETATESLTSGARLYTSSFTDLDRLIDRASSDVLGQLLIRGIPKLISPVSVTSLTPGLPPTVDFSAGDAFLNVGTLCFLNDTLVRDAVFLTHHNVSISEGEMESSAGGAVLLGSRDAWG